MCEMSKEIPAAVDVLNRDDNYEGWKSIRRLLLRHLKKMEAASKLTVNQPVE